MKFNHIPLDIPDIETSTINGLRYYHCGKEKYPSITSVLSSGEPKEYLVAWRERLGEEAAAVETQRCADRGTNVHLLCEYYLNNNKLPDVSETDMKIFNKLKMILRRVSDVRSQECALYSNELRVAGRCDLVACYNGVLSIIDFKTSNYPKSEDQIEDYFIQATFYALALMEMTGIEVKQLVILIAVEKSLQPQVFVKEIKPYIMPLVSRINKFYSA